MPAFDPASLVQALGIDVRAGRRIGLILVEDESVDGAAALRMLLALAASGCRVEGLPADGRALLRRLWRGMDETSPGHEALPLPDYVRWLTMLPAGYEQEISAGWRRPEDDPLFRPGMLDCGHFLIPAARFGDTAIVAWRIRVKPSAALTPPHGHLAAVAWLRDIFGARAILTIDGKGAVALAPPPF